MIAGFIRLGVFITFIALGLSIRDARGKAASMLIAFVLIVTTAVGLTQREMWPFTNWALFHHLAPKRFSAVVVEFIDVAGGIHQSDPRIWHPAGTEEIFAWIARDLASLPPGGREQLAAEFLARAEETRRRLERSGRGSNERLLGSFAAPYHFARRRAWDAPPPPLSGVRFSRISWNPEERAMNAGAVEREVIYEYRRR